MPSPALDYQLLFEESPDVLLVLLPDSPRFTAVAATKARLQSTHSILEQTVGRGLFELFPDNPDDGAADGTRNLRASLERVLATRVADTMAVQKYDIPLPDGGFEAKYWSPCNLPVLGPDGEILYIMHRAVDVTELVRAGELGQELRGLTRDMEREVLQRSRELDAANRQLRDANARLNQLDAAKTAFFSNISHEFRTPLTLMLGPLADALNDPTQIMNNAQRSRLRLAHDNAVRLLKLVNSLLDFARLEAGRLRGTFAPVDLAMLTRDLTRMFQSATDSAGLRLVVECSPLSEPLWIDRDMWEKVVPNLVSNAFKFTLSGAITVRVSESATHAVVEVADTGVGIPAQELPRIFERFHRVHGATGRTHEGAGIGLALVRELVELHGGTIDAHSIVGRGTTIRVQIPKGHGHLPPEAVSHEPLLPEAQRGVASLAHAIEAERWVVALAPDAMDRRSSSTDPAAAPPALKSSASRASVLIVDDNADLRSYMRDLLARDYDVATATDGFEALNRIHERPPDIVLSDVMMPRMTGIELVQALRADPQTVSLPVILLSARAGEDATDEGRDAGSDDYLTKPFTAQELKGRVRALLRLSSARRQWTSELERANRELDAFSASVAHDLRGPLRLIEGFGLMLMEENAQQLDAEGRRRLEMIRGSAKRMSQLIEDLLYLSRLNRSDVKRTSFDLSILIRSIAAQLQSANPDRQVTLLLADGLWVDADPNLLKIAMENLLGNAWKFTAKRREARIEIGVSSSGGERAYFVRDNGAGFDMAYASKLFGAFQRLHADSEFQGTGIGLATVSRIVVKHGGRIWGTGEVNHGATFYFTLGPEDSGARAAA
jgi:signal transduction histidine kinase